jgi:hypothetical protein
LKTHPARSRGRVGWAFCPPRHDGGQLAHPAPRAAQFKGRACPAPACPPPSAPS